MPTLIQAKSLSVEDGRSSLMTSSNPIPLLSPLPCVPQVPLTLPSVLTPGNTPGEPVTPHWVLDAPPWRVITLEEPVSAVSSLPLWGHSPFASPQILLWRFCWGP